MNEPNVTAQDTLLSACTLATLGHNASAEVPTKTDQTAIEKEEPTQFLDHTTTFEVDANNRIRARRIRKEEL